MIVETQEQFDEAVQHLASCPYVSFDTETTGLRPFVRDRIFAVVFSDGARDFYFNFNPRLPDAWDYGYVKALQPIFAHGTRFAHNAKFDMHFLAKEGLIFPCEVHDTEVVARILYNDHITYNLDSCAERALGVRKDDRVKTWMDDHDAFENERVPGSRQVQKRYRFDLVPFKIISEYAMTDARITYDLGMWQLAELKKEPSLQALYENERQLTKTCFAMEERGIKIDREYCEKAAAYEKARYEDAEKKIVEEIGMEFVDSGPALGPVFEKLGFTPSKTEAGNYEVTDKFLETVEHALARYIQEYRDAYKRCHTYFMGFLYEADQWDLIHPNMRQSGTKTGRFSYWAPNLQNVTKDDDSSRQFPIRRAFVPRDGNAFVMIDYNQMEFRMMVDYANQEDLIEKINSGHDPHQATSDLTGLDRKSAKTLNFGLLYGMGIKKLSHALKVDEAQAKKFKFKYFGALPQVRELIYACTDAAKSRGWVFNWLGRRFYFNDPNFAYRATNSIIQGGCADVVKVAMNMLATALPKHGVEMLLQIHDELLFEVPLDAASIQGLLVDTMESVYQPRNGLPLTCSVSHSLQSWGDAVEGQLEEGRDEVQGAGVPGPIKDPAHLGSEDSTTYH